MANRRALNARNRRQGKKPKQTQPKLHYLDNPSGETMSDDYTRPDPERVPDLSAQEITTRIERSQGKPDSMEVVASRAVEDDLKVRFTYHPPSQDQADVFEHLRAAALEIALDIVAITPASREQSVALTKLDEVVMWANAAVARRS